MKKILKFFFFVLMLVGLSVVMFAVIGAVSFMRNKAPDLPKKMTVVYTFYGTPAPGPTPVSFINQFVAPDPSLEDVVAALYRAAEDDRVEAFAARLATGDYDWASVQEIQAGLRALKDAGKKTYVFAESYGDITPGMGQYYLASAFQEIWVQPVGGVSITGFHAEMPYFKSALEKLGIKAEMIQKGKYKTAPEPALRDDMSDAQRETLHAILSSMMTDFFEAVSDGRTLRPERVGDLIDGAPYTADEAKDRNLVDHVGYLDQLTAKLRQASNGDDQPLVNAMDYLTAEDRIKFDKNIKRISKVSDKKDKKPLAALVYINGMIISDAPGGHSPWGERIAVAEDIAEAIAIAAEDPDIGAIVLRVDSPGGSPSASETIRRAVEVAKEKGKYVIVSMAGTAASGGYWVSVDADKIYALPGTLTGSIGVFGGKPDLSGMWDKIGVNWDSVRMGDNADIWSSNAPFSDQARATAERLMDDIYDAFIERVAKGRGFSAEVVEEMAQGRVWTGRQAKKQGLVDELGTMRDALTAAAVHLGVPHLADLDIVLLPKAPDPIEDLLSFLSGGGVKAFSNIKSFFLSILGGNSPYNSLVKAPIPSL